MATRNDLWSYIRSRQIGRAAAVTGPFGERRITYADFTASGRAVEPIERYLHLVLESYGNTHTEDDLTGDRTSAYLRRAETYIKRAVNADEHYRVIACGYGTTGAVQRLQQILGVYIPPATIQRLRSVPAARFDSEEARQARPIVFVGPYEHHSNEVSWRECFAEVVEIDLDPEGALDLDDLREKLTAPVFRGRQKIGAFSAASNVTGLMTPVCEVARLLHEHDALAFFDFAARAPYSRIDVRHGADSFFDGVCFSPHKFLGGPGGAGILVIHERVYRSDLPPTCAAGGTVEYVSAYDQEYSPDIESREKPGTPGILQTITAGLAMELQDALGVERIEQRDRQMIGRALDRLRSHPGIEILGNPDPERRLAICSFNIRAGDAYLHPRFVARLLNDLFGIQSRAGCSCAGPYGHRLLGIGREESLRYKGRILEGHVGLKPGWCRVGFHFLLADEELDFICDAIRFVAENGRLFLPLYRFDVDTGLWTHRSETRTQRLPGLLDIIEAEPAAAPVGAAEPSDGDRCRAYLQAAERLADELRRTFPSARLQTTERDLIPFLYCPDDGA